MEWRNVHVMQWRNVAIGDDYFLMKEIVKNRQIHEHLNSNDDETKESDVLYKEKEQKSISIESDKDVIAANKKELLLNKKLTGDSNKSSLISRSKIEKKRKNDNISSFTYDNNKHEQKSNETTIEYLSYTGRKRSKVVRFEPS